MITKAVLVMLFVLLSSLNAEERIYFPLQNLTLTEDGIVFQSKCAVVPLESVSYDYGAKMYYFSADQARNRTVTHCSYCYRLGWWVEGNCCLLYDCIARCF